jgi:SAM-dependent methyltransferase
MTLTGWIDRHFYSDCANNWDDEMLRETILPRLREQFVLLDLGAGAGIVPQTNFRDRVAKVIGIDLDVRVANNPYLHHGIVANCEKIPLPSDSVDLVFADNVLEHLSNPTEVFSEVFRVLRPGGMFVAKTPNKWHYMALIARVTPLAFHRWYNRLRGRAETDTFRTVYRANSRGDVLRLARNAGFGVDRIRHVERRPEYLRIAAPLYIAGLAYERIVNRYSWLSRFRILILIELQKPVLSNSGSS